jgi:hypothetical protein
MARLGLNFKGGSITLTSAELAAFSCEAQIPAGTLPLPGLERSTLARIHADGHDLVMFLPDRPLFGLQPVAPAEFRVVGWSPGVTIRFGLSGGRVSAVELLIRGLPRTFLDEESPDNPRLPEAHDPAPGPGGVMVDLSAPPASILGPGDEGAASAEKSERRHGAGRQG